MGASDKLDLLALLDHQRRRFDREHEARGRTPEARKANRKLVPVNQSSALAWRKSSLTILQPKVAKRTFDPRLICFNSKST